MPAFSRGPQTGRARPLPSYQYVPCTVDQVISRNSQTTNWPNLARLIRALTVSQELTCKDRDRRDISIDPIDELTALESKDNLKSMSIVSPSRYYHGTRSVQWLCINHLMGGTFRLKTSKCSGWRKERTRTLIPFLLDKARSGI